MVDFRLHLSPLERIEDVREAEQDLKVSWVSRLDVICDQKKDRWSRFHRCVLDPWVQQEIRKGRVRRSLPGRSTLVATQELALEPRPWLQSASERLRCAKMGNRGEEGECGAALTDECALAVVCLLLVRVLV